MRLSDIKVPHEVKNASKCKDLVRAMKRGQAVNPVVVLRFAKLKPRALTGSHRLAALKKVFGNRASVEKVARYVIVCNGDHVYEEARRCGDSKAIAELERLQKAKKKFYYGDLVDAVAPYLEERAQHAVADQGTSGKKLRREGDLS